ncbi:DEAD/DEAH box helicase [Candidatus Nitrospira bockiana]
MPLSAFHPIIQAWFTSRFRRPTDVQAKSWPAINSGRHVLIAAPTGSGKTLAAFLSCLDRLFKKALGGELEDRTEVLYVSPLKALSNDVQKNLQQPLAEIAEAALAAGCLMPEIRVTVRTGDTPVWDRQQMLRRPPHILITTPESLFLLLTAEKSRRILRDVRTVIVDEIHAVAPNKRGAHLALSLERLEALTDTAPVRIGLSATQRPIETVAEFLVGRRGVPSDRRSGEDSDPVIVDVGHRRRLDLAVEVPKDELGAVATNAIWSDLYDRLAEHVRGHRSTLVFVNTRRLVERVSHHLEERLQDLGPAAVAAHHGSLSRQIRLAAEERLKRGQTRVVVATASLELGIDIGAVDLVCQIGSPRSIAVCLQRVGRSGHWVGAIPKGRLFATTRDELIECAALVRAIRTGTLDRLEVPAAPLDILAQQIVAAAATQEWREEDLFALCRRASPYRDLDRREFEAVVTMLAEGIATHRGRGRAYVHHDRIHHRLRARRGARLAAITSGGAIPETANYAVVAEPEGTVVGSVDEDFAVESLAGDIILLGNASWRIRGVEMGKVRVEDAHGAPPTIPFWRGEAPSRTCELSAEVAAVRREVDRMIAASPSPPPEARLSGAEDLFTGRATGQAPDTAPVAAPAPRSAAAVAWLEQACGLDRRGAEQAVDYIAAGRAVLGGVVPTQETVVAERFFDEGGGMQLVLHAPFGGRINRAWGLALRKRFCLSFDFELQAAATDEGLVLSLGERHSFPLPTVFAFLRSESVRETLVQAVLQAPMFMTRWRWNATRALALLRFANGRRVPPQIQRMRAEDLLAAVFPAATACQDNHPGDEHRDVPDHPLVNETIRDCLTEAMDVDGLITLLQRIESGAVRCVAVETPMPSAFSHEILNANPYAYLDDAPLEERRARAVEMRRSLPPELAGELGVLDPHAIAEVAEEAWPVVRDPDELHDALLTLFWVPEDQAAPWRPYLTPLLESGRAAVVTVREAEGAVPGWVAAERRALVEPVLADRRREDSEVGQEAGGAPAVDRGEAVTKIVQGWMECTGPTTAAALARRLRLPEGEVLSSLLALETHGQVLRGQFTRSAVASSAGRSSVPAALSPSQAEWCDRRLLARIHRLTIGILRREIEPVTAAQFMTFLFQWQHVVPGAKLHGEAGLLEVIRQLAGFEAPASAWERAILPARLSTYDPEWLDRLCLAGSAMWGRVSPHPRLEPGEAAKPGRIVPTSVAPISLFPREEANWLMALGRDGADGLSDPAEAVSGVARDLLVHLRAHGASFFADLVGATGHLHAEVEDGLWELAAAGLVTADGFDSLRALLDPRRRRAEGRERRRRPRYGPGRWSALPSPSPAGAAERSAGVERMARQLLRRYGVVFRDLLARESIAPAWRDLLVQYRRMELRGDIRGGRFVGGFIGEQFALPEAVEALRALRRGEPRASHEIRISAADPLNLAGILLPGPRVPAVGVNELIFRDGVVVRSSVRPTGRGTDEGRPRDAGESTFDAPARHAGRRPA